MQKLKECLKSESLGKEMHAEVVGDVLKFRHDHVEASDPGFGLILVKESQSQPLFLKSVAVSTGIPWRMGRLCFDSSKRNSSVLGEQHAVFFGFYFCDFF